MTSFFHLKKSLVTLAAVLCGATVTWAGQNVDNPYAGQYDVLTMPEHSAKAWRPGELIIRLRTENVPNRVSLKKVKGKVRANAGRLNSLFDKYGLEDAEELMPLTGSTVTPKARRAKALNGSEVADRDLSGLYVLRFDPKKTADIHSVAEELGSLDDVDYAEPNYIVYACSAGTSSEYTTDPMYGQQWGISAIKLDKLWDKPVINNKRPVIAILDTGVDIDHPDLTDNIWTNELEAEGAEGSDDDGNGFTDDIHGWDFVNQSGRMRDNNGHGTHCAGIAAAVGGNGIGISGANPDALIMPITVMQSDGTGDVGTIIKGIDYATANGADILSMSFGSFGHSMAQYDALAKAYQKTVLVAAAGNNTSDINNCHPMFFGPMFPAAYNFVLGVMASQPGGSMAGFSNWDCDGPLACGPFSNEQLYNYEVMAPGVEILSTYPGGGYKSLNGTSMACPLVAGAISRLYQCKDIPSKELLFGDLIHTLQGGFTGILDIDAAYKLTDADRIPTLSMVTYRIDDTTSGDGDLRADAGEIIDLYPTIRNFWGQAKNVKLKLSVGENEDPEIVEFITPEVTFDSELSSYSLNESKSPLRFKISDNCVDGRQIRLGLTATCDNISEDIYQEFVFTAENGIELGGIITKSMTLYPDKHYIVTSKIGIPEDVTLTIMPGTTLKFHDNTGFSVAMGESSWDNDKQEQVWPHAGKIIAKGTPDNWITFTKGDLSLGEGISIQFDHDLCSFEYCRFTNLSGYIWIGRNYNKCEFSNCINRSGLAWLDPVNSSHNLITNNQMWDSPLTSRHSTIVKNITPFASIISGNCFGNYYDEDGERYYVSNYDRSDTPQLLNYYFYPGSAKEDIYKYWLWDIKNPYNTASFAQFSREALLKRPDSSAPGCLWKVVVDGYDAQDEFDMLPDLGVGRHKFEVYFSKKMNRDKTPMVAMGVRPPYTQIAIADESSWRTEVIEGDSLDVYTAYLTIKGSDSYDGLNRIYVADAEDYEHFPCPVEDFRFNVNVQSAGSMSAGFMADPGIGKVTLTWDSPEQNFDDMLGYNMYRYILGEDGSVQGDTIRINEKLIENEELTDYDIVPGTTYCYYYTVLRTSLEENSPSRVVSATPRAAGKGDANASGDIDVADVVTEVNYMVGRDPKPFIFDAADVNSDKEIDILDVVGTVNIIMTPADKSDLASAMSVATYTVEDGILYVDTPVELAGVQAELGGTRGTTEIAVLPALRGMESTGDWISDEAYRFIAFSLSGKTLGNGRHALLSIGDASLDNLILVDTAGNRIMAFNGSATGIGSVVMQQMKAPTPNPFVDIINVPVIIGTDGEQDVEISLHSLSGVKMLSRRLSLGYGEHNVALDGSALPAGFYMLTLSVDGAAVQTHKVIKK